MLSKLNPIQVQKILKEKRIYLFSPWEFQRIFGVSYNTARQFLRRYAKKEFVVKLRAGLYIMEDRPHSLYAIANRLYQPSYVSLEKALSFYNLIPEIVYTITSVTTKASREFITPKGAFSYQKIKRQVFTGYSLHQIEGQDVLIADPEKALADYLYFVDLKKALLNDRLKMRTISKRKLLHYVRLFKRPGMLKLVKDLYAQ